MTALSLPSPAKIKATQFRLGRQQAFNPLRGGHHQAVDMGEPLWSCEIETTPLSRAQGGAWKYLLASARGFLRTFFLYDVSRKRPLAYASSADGAEPLMGKSVLMGRPRLMASLTRAWGSPAIEAVDRANSRVLVRGLVAGATISEGDYGHWDDGVTRRLHICDDAIADAAGRTWVNVEPAPPLSSVNLPAAFEMHKASAEMVIVESAAPYSAPSNHEITLRGAQVLRRA